MFYVYVRSQAHLVPLFPKELKPKQKNQHYITHEFIYSKYEECKTKKIKFFETRQKKKKELHNEL